MATDTKIYRVQSGESLSSIARDILGDIDEWPVLAYVNSIQYPYWIKPGQILQLPRTDEVILEVYPLPEVAAKPTTKFATSPATVIVLAIVAAFLFAK